MKETLDLIVEINETVAVHPPPPAELAMLLREVIAIEKRSMERGISPAEKEGAVGSPLN